MDSGKAKSKLAPVPNVRKGQVIAIDGTSGKVRWTLARDWSNFHPGHNGIVAAGDRVAILRITPTQDIWLETYQTSTGKKLWQTQVTKSPRWEKEPSYLYSRYRLLANSNAILVVNNANGRVEGYDWQAGKQKFRLPDTIDPLFEIQLSDSTIYYRDLREERLNAFDSKTGDRIWSLDKLEYSTDIFPTADGTYIIKDNLVERAGRSSSDTLVSFVDAKTGRRQWLKRFPNMFYLEGTVAGSRALVTYMGSSPSGKAQKFSGLQALSREGKLFWRWEDKGLARESTLSATEERVFIVGKVPRAKNWQSALTGGWR